MITSIKIDRLSYDGKGIGYIDGKVAFVVVRYLEKK